MLRAQRLRVHHMLCIPLFAGEGYSDGFSKNMAEKIAWLKENPEEALEVVTDPDMICRRCPNLTPEDTCRCEGNGVKEKDRKLALSLNLDLKKMYTFAGLLSHFRERMTEEIFANSCQKCEWFQKGLCSYERYRKSIGQ